MLESTSHEILPNESEGNKLKKHSLGPLTSFNIKDNIVILNYQITKVYIYMIETGLIRVYANPLAEDDLKESIAVEEDTVPVVANIKETEKEISVFYSGINLIVNKSCFALKAIDENDIVIFETDKDAITFEKSNKVYLKITREENAPVYGLGQNAGFLNKSGELLSNWNTDVYAPHNKDTVELYQSIPYALIHQRPYTIGFFFDNSYRTSFDMQQDKKLIVLSADNGSINIYFIASKDLKENVNKYTKLTGVTPLPPKWAIGYHQSRYSYKSEGEVLNVVNKFIDEKIPLDCIHLDIHYMDGFRVFTSDVDRFPNLNNLVKILLDKGVHIIPIVDPGIKKDHNYEIYKEGIQKGYFCKYLEGEVYYGEVWPGLSAFPDFLNSKVQEWWGNLHKYYTDKGIEGIWNDMNEPSVFNESKTMDLNVQHKLNGKLVSHEKAHNLYGLYMSKSTFEGLKSLLSNKRPFSLTRAGYAGIQRYSAVWTGDNRSHWEHLEMSLSMIMNLGLSGVSFTGADVGGFSSDTTSELLIRWTQTGAMMPYFRNHSVQDSIYQEPYAFDNLTMEIVKNYIELRYQFLPYIYTLFRETEMTGIPVVRPLVMEYPEDKTTYNICDQFLLGEAIMVCPILRPGIVYRGAYFPDGTWINYWTGERYIGNQHHLIKGEIDILPIFVKEGTILPLGKKVLNTKENQQIELIGFGRGELAGELYMDDGISYDYKDNQFIHAEYLFKNDDLIINIQGEFDESYLPKKIKEFIGVD